MPGKIVLFVKIRVNVKLRDSNQLKSDKWKISQYPSKHFGNEKIQKANISYKWRLIIIWAQIWTIVWTISWNCWTLKINNNVWHSNRVGTKEFLRDNFFTQHALVETSKMTWISILVKILFVHLRVRAMVGTMNVNMG